ncbi:MAG: 50S ribosomal protein L19 [Candidatus Coatesbacteria bacterium]|nr:MAG: 50S ribosomal protein L19 [Candidatus Coatesbacteria bacterium]
MRQLVKELEKDQLRSRIPDFNVGDTVRVSVQIIEGQKTRVQDFEGTVIARKHKGVRETFTVRKISSGVGVERIFPLHSPRIVGIKVIRKGDVRRAKLYYLRKRVGKKARIRERVMTAEELKAAREAGAVLGVETAVVEGVEEPVEESEPADAGKPEAETEVTEKTEEVAAAEEVEEPVAEGEPAEFEEPETEGETAESAEKAAAEEDGEAKVEPGAEVQVEPEEKDEEVKGEEAEEDTPKDV